MYTKFVNEKRAIRSITEGFGEYSTVWKDYEYKCAQCNKWTEDIRDVSININEDGSEQGFICDDCAKRNE